MHKEETIVNIENALISSNVQDMDIALEPLYSESDLSEFIPVLISALRSENHFRHEDIVSLFQKAKDPRTCKVLFETSKKLLEHLNYDSTFGLARKCTWALADIGTIESKEFIKNISLTGNQIIAEYANKRIKNWNKNLDRK